MSTAGTVLATAAGAGLIALAAHDAFNTLFHAEGHAPTSRRLTRGIWRAGHFLGPSGRLLPVAGPAAVVATLAIWAGLFVLGWALLYWPHVPEAFRFDPGVQADAAPFVHAVNVSLVTFTTLGFGDITPNTEALRLILPFEALVGFGLLSASISWVLSIYPALSRRRSLAYEISLLRTAEEEDGASVFAAAPESADQLLAELTSRLIAVERDLVHFPVTYYFAPGDDRFSLASSAPYLHDLAKRGATETSPDAVRFRAQLLLRAVDDLARTASDRFHRSGEDTESLLRGYAADHRVAG